jgi:hypothetical protein
VRLPRYVQGFLDRHGRPRHYLRRPRYKRVRLPGTPWTPKFMAAYEAALAGRAAPVEIGSQRTLPGTIDALIVAYYRSDAFLKALAPETQRMRRNISERFRADHGDNRRSLGGVVAFFKRPRPIRLRPSAWSNHDLNGGVVLTASRKRSISGEKYPSVSNDIATLGRARLLTFR